MWNCQKWIWFPGKTFSVYLIISLFAVQKLTWNTLTLFITSTILALSLNQDHPTFSAVSIRNMLHYGSKTGCECGFMLDWGWNLVILFSCTVGVWAQGFTDPALGAWLPGPLAFPSHQACRGVSAVLRAQDAGPSRAQETQDWGQIGRALQEAQCRHGEQDHAAAEETGWAGVLRRCFILRTFALISKEESMFDEQCFFHVSSA